MTTKPKIPVGWRWLTGKETLRKGDRHWDGMRWCYTCRAGGRVIWNGEYIRRAKKAQGK
jgi:hypothetical protein